MISLVSAKAQIFYPSDNGFEAPDLGSGSSAYEYTPTGTGWTFASGSGIAANNSAFDVENATTGQHDGVSSTAGQAGFLQGTTSISQSIYLTGGTYTVSFSAEGRGGYGFDGFDANELTVALNPILAGVTTPATPIFDATPPQDGYFHDETSTTTPFLAAGYYMLTFTGVSVGSGDYTSFIDNVQVNTVTTPEPSTWALLGLGAAALFFFRSRFPIRIARR